MSTQQLAMYLLMWKEKSEIAKNKQTDIFYYLVHWIRWWSKKTMMLLMLHFDCVWPVYLFDLTECSISKTLYGHLHKTEWIMDRHSLSWSKRNMDIGQALYDVYSIQYLILPSSHSLLKEIISSSQADVHIYIFWFANRNIVCFVISHYIHTFNSNVFNSAISLQVPL